jgi:hypothetical protein
MRGVVLELAQAVGNRRRCEPTRRPSSARLRRASRLQLFDQKVIDIIEAAIRSH